MAADKMTIEEVRMKLREEGPGYFLLSYTSAETMPNNTLQDLFTVAATAIRCFQREVDAQARAAIEEEEAGLALELDEATSGVEELRRINEHLTRKLKAIQAAVSAT